VLLIVPSFSFFSKSPDPPMEEGEDRRRSPLSCILREDLVLLLTPSGREGFVSVILVIDSTGTLRSSPYVIIL